LLRLPIPVGTVACAAFVPGYSGGSATDSHRLPWFTRTEHLLYYDILFDGATVNKILINA
jgi:hypothetical protein